MAPPERWSAGMRFGSTADEQEAGESLDQLLAEEEPDPALDLDEKTTSASEEATTRTRPMSTSTGSCSTTALTLGQAGWWPRTREPIRTRRPIWSRATPAIDGGAASAEEAAVHVVEDDDTDIRSGD